MAYQRTLVIIKPDAVSAGVYPLILARLAASLQLTGGFVRTMTELDCRRHYKEQVGRGHWENLRLFMLSGPSLFCKFEGENAIALARAVCMDTRTAFKSENPKNLIHASDSPESAAEEVKFWFDDGPGATCNY